MDNSLRDALMSEASKPKSKGKKQGNRFMALSNAYNSHEVPRR